MKPSNRIWILISRSLSGEANEIELSELSDYLNADAALMQQFELLKRCWLPAPEGNTGITDTASIERIIHLSSRHDPQLQYFENSIRRRRKKRLLVYSFASIALTVAGFLFFFNTHVETKKQATAIHTVDVKYGNRSKTILPDGTTVWLNAGSTLHYKNFTDSLREVDLQGEGYFAVSHQPQRPFIVHTSGIHIKVLGTTFNVKSYPDEKTVETTLINGSVELTKTGSNKSIFLKPNQKIVLYKNSSVPANNYIGSNKRLETVLNEKVKLINLDTATKIMERTETSWVYNRLIFRGDNFEELAKKMERWFNVTCIFTDNKVKSLRFNGSFENETIEEALDALRLAAKFNFKTNNNEVYISSN
ncbi:MAG TPA: FecR family protein [Chitinophagaceae bacterium]|jgi:Fe2+-dicitrate sensor, membrane component